MVLIALLLIPQTRKPIKVGLNKLRVMVWSPSVKNVEGEMLKPFNYTVNDLNNEPQSIPIGQGKVTFLSYWATWCPPCIAELPSIQDVYTDYGDKVNFVLLTKEDHDVVERFLVKKDYALPVYFPQMKAPELLRSRSFPTNYLIDAHGTILIKETGAADWNSQKVRTLLDSLLIN